MTHMTKLIPLHNNNIILGDFNLHLSNSDDLDAAVFNDTIEALGLYQHIHFTTHKSGNVLDLILSEISEKVNIKTVNPGPYISDHRATIATINVKKTRPKQEVIKIRKIHQITSNQWQKEYNEDNMSLNPNLEELVQSFNTELKWTLDKLAPEKETKLSLKTKHPWYSQEQKAHKAKVRRLEQKWLKHKLDSCWEAYKSERNKYYAILKCKKTECYRTKVQDCKGDSCKLHQLVNSLTSKPPEEAWPDHGTKEELANNFAEFFEQKILTIREKFEGIPQYKTEPDTSVPQLAKFTPMTENQVELIIKNMKSKHCELDCIPMHILKEMMPVVLPTIMKIVNLSLSKGIFSEQWKTAIVKPLLKKLGLDLINRNY